MLVIDASCLFEVVAGTGLAETVRTRWEQDPDHSAPHLVDAEVLGIVRREYLLGGLDETAASLAVSELADWPGERVGHRPLLARAWELRASVRSWDALYVALAEALEATLLTGDARLARASGPRCHIEVIGA